MKIQWKMCCDPVQNTLLPSPLILDTKFSDINKVAISQVLYRHFWQTLKQALEYQGLIGISSSYFVFLDTGDNVKVLPQPILPSSAQAQTTALAVGWVGYNNT